MRILWLASWFPSPQDTGNKIRVFNLVRAAASRHEVTLLSFADTGDNIDEAGLTPYAHVAGIVQRTRPAPSRLANLRALLSPLPRSIVLGHSPEMARCFDAEVRTGRYDLLIVCHYDNARYALRYTATPKLLEEIETGPLRGAVALARAGPPRARAWLSWMKTRNYIAGLMRHFNACTVASELERANLMLGNARRCPVAVVPNVVSAAVDHANAVKNPYRLIFNGALSFGANFQAVDYFLREVWPAVLQAEPRAELWITGRTDDATRNRVPPAQRVLFTGYLADVKPAVAEAAVCIAPLQVGGGTRLKILEAMVLGTPVVSTSKGAEGLEVRDGEHLLIGDTPEQFAAQVVRLLRDEELRDRLAANARRLVEGTYDWSVIAPKFLSLLEQVAQC
ncbi:MAG: glycosyltransferase [Chloroflexi bacterium]|nr:glycosyltransferase [Chloroflexota bacterium]